MRFLIYIPSVEGDVTPNDEKLAKVGLSNMSQGCAAIPTPAGPDGKPGVVFSWPVPRDPRSTMGYLPNDQEWVPAEAVGDLAAKRYWVGFVKGFPPTPQDLAWPTLLEGDADSRGTLLGDGRRWVIPAAGILPKTSRFTDGQWSWVVQKDFEAYWNESSQWYYELVTKDINEGQTTVSADCCDYLTRALAMNYRLTIEVVSHLGLFSTLTIGPALMATVHGITLREEYTQKKTDDIPLAT